MTREHGRFRTRGDGDDGRVHVSTVRGGHRGDVSFGERSRLAFFVFVGARPDPQKHLRRHVEEHDVLVLEVILREAKYLLRAHAEATRGGVADVKQPRILRRGRSFGKLRVRFLPADARPERVRFGVFGDDLHAAGTHADGGRQESGDERGALAFFPRGPGPLPDEHARVRAGRRRVEREDEAIARVEARRVVRHLHRAGVEIGRAADVVQRDAVDVAGIAVVRVFKPGGDAARADDHPSPEESEEMVGFLPDATRTCVASPPNASSISFARSALAPFSSAVLSRPCQK